MPEENPLAPYDPRRLGEYELLARLGEGGQGVVYKGRSASGATVAVKLLHASLAEKDLARRRFVRELAAARRVARFCTAQILDADVEGDRPYIVSEFVDGPSLASLVAEKGPRSGADLERLAIGAATALAAIHRAGLVHRDFKPHNVLIAADGPRVIDFGIARALDAGSTVTSRAVGTPAYMSPEQLGDGPVGPPADVFAWGLTVAYAANGSPPFGADSIPQVINRILNGRPDLGRLPEPLRSLVATCLQKDPARRPTAEQFVMHLIGEPVEAAGPEHVLAAGAAGAAGEVRTVPVAAPEEKGSQARLTALVATVLAIVFAAIVTGAVVLWPERGGANGASGAGTVTSPPPATVTVSASASSSPAHHRSPSRTPSAPRTSDSPTSKPPPGPGLLRASPANLVLPHDTQTGTITLRAEGGEVKWSWSGGTASDLQLTPSSGTIPAGGSVQVSVGPNQASDVTETLTIKGNRNDVTVHVTTASE